MPSFCGQLFKIGIKSKYFLQGKKEIGGKSDADTGVSMGLEQYLSGVITGICNRKRSIGVYQCEVNKFLTWRLTNSIIMIVHLPFRN
jgi:hypothetical protein